MLAEVFAAAALGTGTRLREPKFIVFYGERGRNGKSAMLDAMTSLVPPEAISSVSPGEL